MRKIKGFTLVEIMIVVAILGLLIAIGVPGFLTARNKSRNRTEGANLKAIADNIASYGVNERQSVDVILRLWPSASTISDPGSYIRRQLLCPINKVAYSVDNATNIGSCTVHGLESMVAARLGGE
ncbi:MAG: prepilin-type N-terminal cleavage/methylation domain-containing protein [Candidatus Aureabacteria bacterium]|nr:prepilin-type N-terminal cleavage/methylation domain-containing protein [Candidatus Auribacterota bacterium]